MSDLLAFIAGGLLGAVASVMWAPRLTAYLQEREERNQEIAYTLGFDWALQCLFREEHTGLQLYGYIPINPHRRTSKGKFKDSFRIGVQNAAEMLLAKGLISDDVLYSHSEAGDDSLLRNKMSTMQMLLRAK